MFQLHVMEWAALVPFNISGTHKYPTDNPQKCFITVKKGYFYKFTGTGMREDEQDEGRQWPRTKYVCSFFRRRPKWW